MCQPGMLRQINKLTYNEKSRVLIKEDRPKEGSEGARKLSEWQRRGSTEFEEQKSYNSKELGRSTSKRAVRVAVDMKAEELQQ